MPEILTERELNSDIIKEQVMLLETSFAHWFLESLIPYSDAYDLSLKLYHAPFLYFSINEADEPVYSYMNLRAQNRFETSWDDVPQLTLRETTVPESTAAVFLFTEGVKQRGKFMNYFGTRMSRKGRVFRIQNAYVWAIFDAAQNYRGQGYLEPLF